MPRSRTFVPGSPSGAPKERGLDGAALAERAGQVQQAQRERSTVVERDEAERQRAIQEDVATLVESALASDIGCVWNASATQHRDRKELIRILVKALVIEKWADRVRVRIGWADGAPDQMVDVWPPAAIEHLVREAHVQGKSWPRSGWR